ncbi:MAG: hypothetical protein QG623_300, partial [Patescibacteria group bacterium]|nr:hypothetical protein [Patescibacteria group bacterium]
KTVLPGYIFEISDINEALDPINAGGNCGAVTYLGLNALEDSLGSSPGFSTQFGFIPHFMKENGKVIVGHALGRFEIGGFPYVFNQTRDGDIRIGAPDDFEIDERTLYYPTEEGYANFLETLYSLWNDEAPEFDRVDVMRMYKKALANARAKQK